MRTPNKPLFIIDSSRSHGRGRETEWISCTSSECPFIAMGTIITEQEYQEQYDRNAKGIAYSDNRQGFRYKVEVVKAKEGADETTLRNLLRRLLKEILTRHKPSEVRNEATAENCLTLINELIKQNNENLRERPNEQINIMVRKILLKMKNDYETNR